ncbi:hypothetical protein QUA35_22910 [Microcoleus sp. N9_B2]|uniref:hypothetical protein n=1 Tax=unclassified Microcoleus TaxID=2642155 RepID=UPI002FD61B91
MRSLLKFCSQGVDPKSSAVVDVVSALASEAGGLSLAPIARQYKFFASLPTFERAIELGVEPGTVKCGTDDASKNSGIHHRRSIVQPTNHINAFGCSNLLGG